MRVFEPILSGVTRSNLVATNSTFQRKSAVDSTGGSTQIVKHNEVEGTIRFRLAVIILKG